MADAPHEVEFVRSFVVADKQERWLQKLSSARHRKGFLQELCHRFDFEPKFTQPVPPAQQRNELILELLRAQGAPENCQLISAREELDRRTLALRDALASVVGMGEGVILICRPGSLAYFESEDLGGRYLLRRQGLAKHSGRK